MGVGRGVHVGRASVAPGRQVPTASSWGWFLGTQDVAMNPAGMPAERLMCSALLTGVSAADGPSALLSSLLLPHLLLGEAQGLSSAKWK